MSFVYFMSCPNRKLIRIGFTKGADPSIRMRVHMNYGYKTLAIISGSESNERSLHEHFARARLLDPDASDQSRYAFDAVFPYVERLLHLEFATADLVEAISLPRIMWQLWSPETISKPLMRGNQGLLFVTSALKAEARDTWQTPEDIAEVCRRALGGHITLDPASCFEANRRIRAEYFYDEKRNGLNLPWGGSVFLNPPYGGEGEVGAKLFVEKLVGELMSGRVGQAITILNLQSVPTLWFPLVRNNAAAHAIWNRRIPFLGPAAKSGRGTKYGASKNGTIFSYFGEEPTRFMNVFRQHAWVFRKNEAPTELVNGASSASKDMRASA